MCCGCGCGGGGGADVTITATCFSMPLHACTQLWGAMSLWTRPPALYLCTGPSKIPTHHVRALQLRDKRSFQHSEPHGTCCCTQRACNLLRNCNCGSSAVSSTSALENCRTCSKEVDHLINELQQENLYGKRTKGICSCATTGMSSRKKRVKFFQKAS